MRETKKIWETKRRRKSIFALFQKGLILRKTCPTKKKAKEKGVRNKEDFLDGRHQVVEIFCNELIPLFNRN